MNKIEFLDVTNQDYFEEYFWDENEILVPTTTSKREMVTVKTG